MRLKAAACALMLVMPSAQAIGQAIDQSGARPTDRYWQCAAFARQFSGLAIRANALDWWAKAEGLYARGLSPRIGAVMAFVPHGGMRLGHVATVTGIVGPRDITVTHANWSLIDGTRGQIEYDVPVRDVSEANDWSEVRVYYAPLGDLGTTAWPVRGFIYPERIDASTRNDASMDDRGRPAQTARRRPLDILPDLFRALTHKPRVQASARFAPTVEEPKRQPLIGADVMRLAMLEARQTPRR